MPESHAQIARRILAAADPRAFSYAARAAVIDGSYLQLEHILPGMKFAHRNTGPDQWELVGTCTDGSVVVWGVGA